LKPFADYANAPITTASFHFCLFIQQRLAAWLGLQEWTGLCDIM
jgi:hypothetical protein